MKVLILYRPASEYARPVEEFAQDFTRQRPDKKLELVSLDTRDGAALASLYDVMQYPAILVLTNEGQILNSWQGPQLPLMSEVSYFSEP